jgi:rhamnulokinase
MPEQNFLAFDLGAESGRALLGRLNGGVLSLEEKHRFANPNGKINGHLHWNLLAQWEELKMGLKKAGARLDGIGVDTWGVDFGLIGRDGTILGNPYMYRDSRTEGMMEAAFKKVPRDKIFEHTGIQFMQLNTLFQLFAMAQAKSPLLEVAETLLFMPDLFNYLFTGLRKSEFSIATTSQMYDPRKQGWANEMLEQLGIPTRVLPTIIPSATTIGPLSREVADECEVAQVPVIAPGCHDTASAVASVPAQGDAWCYISSGTWSLMGVEIDQPIINEKSLRYNYTNEGGVGGTIRFLKNIMGLWLVQECRRQFTKDGYDHSYAELTQMAERATGFGAVINPDHGPFLSPGDMPGKIERFCKETRQPPPTTRGDFVRTCLDSLALTYRKTLEGLEDILGTKITTIHIVGGGSQNLLLNQMTASACGRTVIAGPVEGTAIGNILAQAMATGSVQSLSDARQVVRASFDVKRYEPRDTAKWDQANARYREIVGKV